MRSIHLFTAALAVIGLTGAASAADMPARNYTKAPPMVAGYNWTGLYAGLNGGYGWVDTGGNPGGFVGGGQIGYNWQAYGSPLVLGLEADIQGADIDETVTGGGISTTTRINAFGTVRGRIGYAWDRFMVYGTGGFAYTRTELSATNGVASVSDKSWSSGYTLGGGLEWGAWDRWTVKAEYLFIHSGDVNLNLAGVPVSGNYDFSVVRAGLNYRF
ncbi:outer membrane protein [Undibacter mobilis]|uniref:Porin family protein n=1 Tax=Undibacter mobilis TaxID=2292256 RepID=A0A371B0X2_9BRAD|nr:outer membrane protein [Undibacter mobilis]RDV01111.1 porin family protein [Undibacter mobilis]